jgi:hypothetical protein
MGSTGSKGSKDSVRPKEGEYAPYFRGYVERVPEEDVLAVLEAQPVELRRAFDRVPPAKETFAYAPGKWTLRQVAGHVVDGERVFAFRSLCASRADKNSLPGFDENAYVANSRFDEVPLADHAEEFALLRTANVQMLRRLSPEQWRLAGVANGVSNTVRAIAYVMAGHVRHHLRVMAERYGVEVAAPRL